MCAIRDSTPTGSVHRFHSRVHSYGKGFRIPYTPEVVQVLSRTKISLWDFFVRDKGFEPLAYPTSRGRSTNWANRAIQVKQKYRSGETASTLFESYRFGTPFLFASTLTKKRFSNLTHKRSSSLVRFRKVLTSRKTLRKRWDLNSRYGFPYAAFRERCLQPLSHASVKAFEMRIRL